MHFECQDFFKINCDVEMLSEHCRVTNLKYESLNTEHHAIFLHSKNEILDKMHWKSTLYVYIGKNGLNRTVFQIGLFQCK